LFKGGPYAWSNENQPTGTDTYTDKNHERLGITEGDYVEVDVKDSDIILKPRKLIDPSQGWYWTKEWQKIEASVDDEIAEGHVSPKFKTVEEGLKWLKK